MFKISDLRGSLALERRKVTQRRVDAKSTFLGRALELLDLLILEKLMVLTVDVEPT